MPKLSIVIPVYNAAPYLKGCLDSLLAQTFSDFEAICVDDGSSDGSDAILQGFTELDKRIKVELREHAGVSSARNHALDLASGEWVAFLDADDTIEQDWLQRMMIHAVDDVDIVHANASYCFHGASGRQIGHYRVFLKEGWTVLNFVRREAIGEVRFKTGMRFKEDVVFFVELALKTNRIVMVNERGYNYIPRIGSAVNSYVKDEDCLRFRDELHKLGLPRCDYGQFVGYDLVTWVRGRDQAAGYDPSECKILAFWRAGIKSGELRYRDVRWWWWLGLWYWLKTGDDSVFRKTACLRVKVGSFFKNVFA